jgi:hypothetical protein
VNFFLERRKNEIPVDTLLSGKEGEFSISSLREGRYTLVVEAPGFVPEILDGVEAFREGVRDLQVELKKGGSLRVVLQDTEGNPLRGCSLSITDEEGIQYRKMLRTPLFSVMQEEVGTGKGGVALVRDMLPKLYKIEAKLQGYAKGYGEALIVEGETAEVVIPLVRK